VAYSSGKALIGAVVMFVFVVGLEATRAEEFVPGGRAEFQIAQAAGKSAPTKANAAKTALPEQVRTRLRQECISEHGGAFRVDAASDAQCECYATNVVKALRPDDLEFYMNYNVVPTLSGTRPENVKKSCGIKLLDQSGSRSRPPEPAPN